MVHGPPPGAGSDDLCFAADADLDAITAHLAACGVDIEVGPVERAAREGR